MTSGDRRALDDLARDFAEMQREIELLKAGQNASTLGNSSVDDGALVFTDGNGTPVLRLGKQDDGTYVGGVAIGAQDPPEVPAAPTVTPGLGGTLKIASHGSVEPPWPANFSHLNVWVQAADAEVEPDAPVGTIIGTGDSLFITTKLDTTPYRCWLTSVNISGAESDPSEAVTATPALVVGQDILDGAIAELQLADEAVSAAKIAVAAIANYHFGDKVVDLRALGDESVGSDQLVAAAILARHIGAQQVTAAAIVAEAIQAGHIAAEAIQAGHLAADSITSRAILALAITADKMAANSVTAGAIAAGSITADKIRAGEVLADVSLATGTSGRRVVVSGPANEIQFYPALNEAAKARIFSYVPIAYPDDVVLEMRAISSAATAVTPRMFLSPDAATIALTDSADDTVARGGFARLEEGAATFGLRTGSAQPYGLGVYDGGLLSLRGYFQHSLRPNSNDALLLFAVTLNNLSTTKYIMRLVVTYPVTMDTLVAPVLSCGAANAVTTNYTVRSESVSTSGMTIRIGTTTSTALKPQESLAIYCWGFRVPASIPLAVVGTDL
jgi:hypothetical protein